jgi:hypothetical protein
MRPHRRRALGAAAMLCLWTLSAGPPALASYDPAGSGATRLTFDKSFLAAMKRSGVVITATRPAKLVRGSVSFPVSGGKVDPTTGRGSVDHEGAVVFAAGKRRIPVRDLQLKTTQRGSPLSARVGGSQLKLGAARDLAFGRAGFGARATVSGLALSSKLATRLGKKLRLKSVFREGLPLGRSTTVAQPETIAVLGKNAAALTLDPGLEDKLRSLFVAVNPIFPAEHVGAAFTIPLTGGAISADGSVGTIQTAGALEFIQLGGGQVFWQDAAFQLANHIASAELNVQPSPPYVGKVEGAPFAGLTLPSAPVANPGPRTVTVANAVLTLDASTAATFNEVFAKPQDRDAVFAAGETLGAVSFTAQGH